MNADAIAPPLAWPAGALARLAGAIKLLIASVVGAAVRGNEHGDGRPAIGFDFVVVLCSRLIEARDNQEIGSFEKRGKLEKGTDLLFTHSGQVMPASSPQSLWERACSPKPLGRLPDAPPLYCDFIVRLSYIMPVLDEIRWCVQRKSMTDPLWHESVSFTEKTQIIVPVIEDGDLALMNPWPHQ
ncbi:hypothetical protein ABH905_000224 [Pseudomonas frederiksbergensis]